MRPSTPSPIPTRFALVGLLLLLAGCHRAPTSPTFTVRAAELQDAPPAPDLGPVRLRVMHTADSGDPTPQQRVVLAALAKAHRTVPFDLAFVAGDNIYDCGPDARLPGAMDCRFQADGNHVVPGYKPPFDPWMEKAHDRPFGKALHEPRIPLYLTLGNHDVGVVRQCAPREGDPVQIGRAKACLNVAHSSPVWKMPARHYVLDEGPARFIAIDSNLMSADYGGLTWQGELDFLKEALAGCEERSCFMVSHHPPASAGQHREKMNRYRERIDQVVALTSGKVRAWLSGHDHDLQHLRTADGQDVLISGNACRGRADERFDKVYPPEAKLLYGSVVWGFAELEVRARGWLYRFIDPDGASVYCCAAVGAGQCQPVQCPARGDAR